MTGTLWTLDWWAGTEGSAPTPDAAGNLWYVEKVLGWHDAPAPRSNVVDRDGSDGVFDGPTYLPGRVITIDGWVESLDQFSLLQAVRRLRSLLTASPRVATLVGIELDLTLQASVRRDGQTLVTLQSPTWADYELLLYAPDATLYGQTLNHTTTGLYSGAAGRVYPLVYPMVYGALGNQGFATIVNAGNTTAYPTLTITAPSNPLVNPQVRLVGGPLIRLGMTLTVGDSVVIDLAQQTIVLNGAASRYYTLTPDSAFFSIPPGTYQLLFTADSGTGGQLDAAWRNPYA